MNKIILIPIMLLSTTVLTAQQSISSLGGNTNGDEYSLSYTIGQIAILNSNDKNYFLSEGVQQTYFVWKIHISAAAALPCEINISPNPSSDVLNIRSDSDEELNYIFYSASGKIIVKGKFVSSTHLSVHNLADGMYFVKITNDKGQEKKYQIVKSN